MHPAGAAQVDPAASLKNTRAHNGVSDYKKTDLNASLRYEKNAA